MRTGESLLRLKVHVVGGCQEGRPEPRSVRVDGTDLPNNVAISPSDHRRTMAYNFNSLFSL